MGMSLSLVAAASLSTIYVGSLYVWKSDQDRDSPYTIRRRFLSAFCTVCISPFIVKAFGSPTLLSQWPFPAVIGIRSEGLVNACLWPLILTAILFTGPLAATLSTDSDLYRLRSRLYNWKIHLTDWVFWRNYVVAPFTEEFTFRYRTITFHK